MSNGESSKAIGFVIAIAAVVILAIIGGIWASRNSTKKEERQAEIATEDSYVKGNLESDIEIIEFADFQCPACKATQPILNEVLAQHPEVKFVYKHFPLSQHEHANLAALAAEAAGSQGKFYEYHDLLYDRQEEWSTLQSEADFDKMVEYAEESGVEDISRFRDQIENEEHQGKIDRDVDLALKIGVSSTPTIFVNGREVAGRSSGAFDDAIAEAREELAGDTDTDEGE